VAAPAPGAAPQPAQTQAQPASRTPPPAEPAPAFVPSGKSAARVNFMTGSSDLPENAKPQLKAVAEQMNRDGDMRVQLLAYAGPRDDTASQTRRLSLFRALAVRTYLIEQGIRSTRMDVRAMGNKYDEEPADRVDVVIADR
jgi:outer membrane protein OmpA-like peptidoglycan-associated protein